ncbi:MAG: T9SS type A sorting domain-containing protein [Candidatus Kapabacteria bacterium]|nr:T9SS type A sorting domain-containing protein [Ignavibacteriota bacterium]MCW5883955.1 T9SS type A sorting domain-containing protein [Candidatus Kapabacteria bacterium]
MKIKKLQIGILLFAISLIFGVTVFSEQQPPDPLEYREMPFVVLHYDVYLDLNRYTSRQVEGVCTITVARNRTIEGDKFIFHLERLNINSITSNGIDLDFEANGQAGSRLFHYTVGYPDEVSDTVDFVIEYSGVMTAENAGTMSWGGVHYEEAVLYALGVGFRAPYVSTTRHWMPCFDHPQNKATYRGTFKVPDNFKVASNGYLAEVRDTDEGAKEFVWEHNYPAATYLLTFAAGPYVLIENNDYKVPIQIFSLPIDSTDSEFAYSEVTAMNDCYESLFGDYPFEKIGYTNVRKGAMEHQTMVSMPRSIIVRLSVNKDSNNEIAAHELSHMWFGNLVTPLDFRHAWMNESFATYCESLWLRCRNGQQAYLLNQKGKADEYLKLISKEEGVFPLYDFPRDLPSSNYPMTIYEKGAVILGMLDWQLEQEGLKFEELITQYLQIFAYGNAQTNDVFRVIEYETDMNWDWFADQWIYRGGWPIFDIITFSDMPTIVSDEIEIRQVQEGELFINVPLEITYYLNDGSKLSEVVNISDPVTKHRILPENPSLVDSIKINEGNIVAGIYELRDFKSYVSVNEGNHVNIPEIYQEGNYLCINYQSAGGEVRIIIIDVLGNTILSRSNYNKSGMNSERIILENLNSGIYFLNITIKNETYTHKISIVN